MIKITTEFDPVHKARRVKSWRILSRRDVRRLLDDPSVLGRGDVLVLPAHSVPETFYRNCRRFMVEGNAVVVGPFGDG